MKISLLVMTFSLAISLNSAAKLKVLYGSDDRREVRNHPSEVLRNLSKSVAGRVNQNDLYAVADSSNEQLSSAIRELRQLYMELGIPFDSRLVLDAPDSNRDITSYEYEVDNLQQRINACSTERFLDQPVLMSCTGFLVGKDLLVTAGHCMVNNFDCSGFKWVFDFQEGVKKIPSENVYSCEKILAQEQVSIPILGTTDYALIKLDREVTTGAPLKFRTEGRIEKGTSVAVIGHPLGLPLKIADNARVRAVFGKTFKANLDTYGGNSGSPVVDAKTGLVEGILVHGADDLEMNGDCTVSRREDGKKEGIYKITRLKFLQDYFKSNSLD
ncbi:serine protease [Halobacteriovorax sp. HLS]|uniref:trypsin-like serine peptidase n=1 Tax=Halobacteriovorax sp. HLS TaxID=2234000 RepID=UPI000FD7ADEA|nr:serine protease [Halobacteriovorax sp. HLS]